MERISKINFSRSLIAALAIFSIISILGTVVIIITSIQRDTSVAAPSTPCGPSNWGEEKCSDGSQFKCYSGNTTWTNIGPKGNTCSSGSTRCVSNKLQRCNNDSLCGGTYWLGTTTACGNSTPAPTQNPGGGTNPTTAPTCTNGSTRANPNAACGCGGDSKKTTSQICIQGRWTNSANCINAAKCNATATPTPTKTITPTTSVSNKVCGTGSSTQCLGQKEGYEVSGTCRCESAPSCQCVGLRNRGEGQSCSADTNCNLGLSCVNGKCSKTLAGIGQSCRYSNDCQSGLCTNGKCALNSTDKGNDGRLQCGVGFCPSGDYLCQSAKCVAVGAVQGKMNGSRLPVANRAERYNAILNIKKEIEAGAGFIIDAETGDVVVISGCRYNGYQPPSMAVDYKVVVEGKLVTKSDIRKGFCCNGYTDLQSDPLDRKSFCQSNPEYYDSPSLSKIVIQNDPILTNLTITDRNGNRCNFGRIACGPSSVAWIINKNGGDINSPAQLIKAYGDDFICGVGTSIEGNTEVLNRYNLNTMKVVDRFEDEGMINDDEAIAISNSIRDGQQLLILVSVQLPNGMHFNHFAVIEGFYENKTMEGINRCYKIFDPFVDKDGDIKKPETQYEYINFCDTNKDGFKYELKDVTGVAQPEQGLLNFSEETFNENKKEDN